MEQMKAIRSKDRCTKRQEKKEKDVESYDWTSLVQEGKVGKLTVQELNKYLGHHNLSHKGKKMDKVRRVIAHISKGFVLENQEIEVVPESDDAEDDTDNEDLVLAEIGDSGSESESDSELDTDFVNDVEMSVLPRSQESNRRPEGSDVTTRSGRTVR
jgi:hypothetical protein